MESETLGLHKISPLARLFPCHSDETYEALKRDIALYGQTEPIARHRGLILDGVHRLQACIDLGKKPWIVDLIDDVNQIAYVVSKNLHRRNLAKGEKVVLAFRISEGSGPGRPSEGQGGHYPTIEAAAKALSVPRRSVEQVRRVAREGVAELRQAVLDYSIKASDAERIIDRPAEVQRRAVERRLRAEFRTVAAAADKVEQEISEKADAEAANALLSLPLSETVTLVNSTVSNLHRLVEAESVILIFAYPPVGKRHLDLFCDLAAFAVHALRPEGLMALLADSTLLPEITKRAGRDDLRYLIEYDYRFPGRSSKLPHPHRGTVNRQPLLIYGKQRASLPAGPNFIEEPRDDGSTGSGQPTRLLEQGMAQVVSRFLPPGGTGCQPLLLNHAGFAIAARRFGCRFIGASDNPKFIRTLRDRLELEEAKSRDPGEGKALPGKDGTEGS